MIYAEALERQVALLRLFRSDKGREFLEGISDDPYRHWGAPGTPRGTPTQLAERMRGQLVTVLERAEPFWWAPDLSAAAAVMAQTLPSWTLTAEDAPAPAGFFWFAEPVPLPLYPGREPAPLRAISWEPILETLSQRPAMQFWYWMATGLAAYPALPAVCWGWALGASLEQAEEEAITDPDNRPRVRAMCRFTAACWALIAQRLFDIPRQRADRAAARRLKREGYPHEPLIRVVELRRVEHTGSPAREPESVEWSCRWLVRGHWRQQPYGPGQTQRRPTWIAPHVKGPEEKPLKPPRATVFAVVR